ncbi:MAG: hypothetical protein ABSG25_09680 [Bryobacteraceae bacterium]
MTKNEIAKYIVSIGPNGSCYLDGNECDKCFLNNYCGDGYTKAKQYLNVIKLRLLNEI